MKRWTVAALAAATLISATAIAGTLAQVDSTEQPTATRWHADKASTSNEVSEYVPSVNFQLAGQAPGAFVLP